MVGCDRLNREARPGIGLLCSDTSTCAIERCWSWIHQPANWRGGAANVLIPKALVLGFLAAGRLPQRQSRRRNGVSPSADGRQVVLKGRACGVVNRARRMNGTSRVSVQAGDRLTAPCRWHLHELDQLVIWVNLTLLGWHGLAEGGCR